MSRSASTVNTNASSTSVRTVATSDPAGMRTTSGCGADNQNVTGARAAEGGEQSHAQQFEELDVIPVRNAVEAVEELVDHEGKGLD